MEEPKRWCVEIRGRMGITKEVGRLRRRWDGNCAWMAVFALSVTELFDLTSWLRAGPLTLSLVRSSLIPSLVKRLARFHSWS